MTCSIRDSAGNWWTVPSRVTDHDLYVDVTPQRHVLVGDGDDGVVAFAEHRNPEDYHDAIDDEVSTGRYGSGKIARVMVAIFANEKFTPELDLVRLVMDGVDVYKIDLDPIMPGCFLFVPCRLVPPA